jgi:Spy/CpxP family protein refolding chaperone
MPRFSTKNIAVLLLLGLWVLVGCDPPQCREETPMEEVEEDMFDRLDDQLDEVDATDTQRQQITGLAKRLVPQIDALRQKSRPRTVALLSELQKDEPERARLEAMHKDVLKLYMDFSRDFIPVLMEGHRVLTPEQRIAWFKKDRKPAKPFKGSWLIDRGLDLFLLRLKATPAQKELTIQIKDELIRRSQPMQKKLWRLRIASIDELQKDNPDPEVIFASVETMGKILEEFILEAIDHYLDWRSSLDKEQKAIVDSYLRSFKPCEPGEKP